MIFCLDSLCVSMALDGQTAASLSPLLSSLGEVCLLHRCAHWVSSFARSISVPNQAFLDASSAQNPALTYGASGIMGLGFTSLSTVDALVNRTQQASGRSLLYNLFNDNPKEPNFIAFSLQRASDPTDEVDGTFLIGELDPDYTAVEQSTPLPTFPEVDPNRWNVLLDAVIVGSTVVPLTTTVPGAPTNKAVVLLDSGTSYTCVDSLNDRAMQLTFC